MVLMCCLVAFIAALAIISSLAIAFGIDDGFVPETEAPDEMDELPLPPLDPKEPVPDATTKRTTTLAPTTSMRTTTTTTTTTTETTLPTTTGTPTASTKSPRLSMDEQPLVCTMGSRTNSVQMFPQDGLCEYLFFDSVDKDNRNPLALPNEWDIDLRVFLNAPSRYSTTAFGIGFAFEKAFSVYRQLGNTTPSLLQPFWRNDIFHFGILDTATRNPWRADVELALLVLKALDTEATMQRRRGNPSFIFFAGLVTDDQWLHFYNDKFTNFYQPDLFIAQGHYFYGDNIFRLCRVMPPTLLSRPAGIEETYQHDLNVAAGTLNRLSGRGLPIIWALSVTMKGRWTIALPFQGYDEFFSSCVHNTTAASFGSYSEVCRNDSFLEASYSRSADAVLAVHESEPVLFAYDNELGLARKLCTVKAQRLSLRFGIAVYDLDYEDFSNFCGPLNKFGAFSRLHAIRSILNFYRTKFNRFADLRPCWQFVPRHALTEIE
ncbi:uncharacterized protein LOC144096994 [Amblyomma americanum]